MNEMIESFILQTYTPEFVLLIKRAFSLFEAFDHQDAYQEMQNTVMNESVSNLDTRSQQFSVALANQLNYVAKEHLVYFEDEITVSEMVTILDALYRFQFQQDYIAIGAILDTDHDPIDKFSLVLQELTEWDQGKILSLIETIDPSVVDLMQKYIKTKEDIGPAETIDPKIVLRFKLLVEACGSDHTGYVLMEAGMPIGYPVHLYLPFVQEHFIFPDHLEQTALNLLSIFYLSNLDQEQMLTQYRLLAEDLFKTLDEVGKVEGHFLNLLSKIEDYRKIHYEKARVSKESPVL